MGKNGKMVQTDGLSSFLEKKDFDPSGFCFKSSYQDLFREFSFLADFGCFCVIDLFCVAGVASTPPSIFLTADTK